MTSACGRRRPPRPPEPLGLVLAPEQLAQRTVGFRRPSSRAPSGRPAAGSGSSIRTGSIAWAPGRRSSSSSPVRVAGAAARGAGCRSGSWSAGAGRGGCRLSRPGAGCLLPAPALGGARGCGCPCAAGRTPGGLGHALDRLRVLLDQPGQALQELPLARRKALTAARSSRVAAPAPRRLAAAGRLSLASRRCCAASSRARSMISSACRDDIVEVGRAHDRWRGCSLCGAARSPPTSADMESVSGRGTRRHRASCSRRSGRRGTPSVGRRAAQDARALEAAVGAGARTTAPRVALSFFLIDEPSLTHTGCSTIAVRSTKMMTNAITTDRSIPTAAGTIGGNEAPERLGNTGRVRSSNRSSAERTGPVAGGGRRPAASQLTMTLASNTRLKTVKGDAERRFDGWRPRSSGPKANSRGRSRSRSELVVEAAAGQPLALLGRDLDVRRVSR